MDKLAQNLLSTPPLDADILLSSKFNDAGLQWEFFYKTYGRFMNVYYKSQKCVLGQKRSKLQTQTILPVDILVDELTDQMKRQVFMRDNSTCLCCGRTKQKGHKLFLNADHIQP